MIAILDGKRDLLEDLGGGLGVTDPVSGDAVLELSGSSSPGSRSWAVSQFEFRLWGGSGPFSPDLPDRQGDSL